MNASATMNDPSKCGHYGHRNKAGEPCGANVIKGTKGCRRHAGTTLAEAKAKGAVVVELKHWGLDGHTELADPGETLLRLVTQSRARCELYGSLLGQAYEAAERLKAARAAEIVELREPEVGWDADREESIPEDPALQTARLDLQRIFNTGGVGALVGYKFDVDRSGRVFAADEAIRGLAALEAQERDRLAGFCAKAVAAGLGERMVRLAELQGEMLFAVIALVVRRVGRDPESPEMREVVAEAIRSVTGVGMPVIEGGLA